MGRSIKSPRSPLSKLNLGVLKRLHRKQGGNGSSSNDGDQSNSSNPRSPVSVTADLHTNSRFAKSSAVKGTGFSDPSDRDSVSSSHREFTTETSKTSPGNDEEQLRHKIGNRLYINNTNSKTQRENKEELQHSPIRQRRLFDSSSPSASPKRDVSSRRKQLFNFQKHMNPFHPRTYSDLAQTQVDSHTNNATDKDDGSSTKSSSMSPLKYERSVLRTHSMDGKNEFEQRAVAAAQVDSHNHDTSTLQTPIDTRSQRPRSRSFSDSPYRFTTSTIHMMTPPTPLADWKQEETNQTIASFWDDTTFEKFGGRDRNELANEDPWIWRSHSKASTVSIHQESKSMDDPNDPSHSNVPDSNQFKIKKDKKDSNVYNDNTILEWDTSILYDDNNDDIRSNEGYGCEYNPDSELFNYMDQGCASFQDALMNGIKAIFFTTEDVPSPNAPNSPRISRRGVPTTTVSQNPYEQDLRIARTYTSADSEYDGDGGRMRKKKVRKRRYGKENRPNPYQKVRMNHSHDAHDKQNGRRLRRDSW